MHRNIANLSIATRRFVIFIASTSCCIQVITAYAATQNTLQQQLQRKVSVTWRGQQLAKALTRLSHAGGIDLWIDRRVDRQRTVAIEVVELPLEATLRSVCSEHSLGMTKLTNVVYIGPVETAGRLTALIEKARAQVERLPTALKNRWVQPKPVTWSRLSEPRQLVRGWLGEANLQLVGAEQIPHDLWPQQELPPLALIDRIVLLLAGFDLTCQLSTDGKSCEIVPLEPTAISTQSDHVSRSALPQPTRRRTPSKKSRQVYTLRLKEKPLGIVLDHFAKQMQLEFIWPDDAGDEDRNQLVSCDVSKADFDELLTAILSGTNLRYRKQDERVLLETKP